MLIIGVDPSLTATGLALLRPPVPTTGGIADIASWDVTTVASKPSQNPDPHRGMDGRMYSIVSKVSEFTAINIGGKEPVTLTVVEGPAFAKNNGMAHERAGLWWRLYALLSAWGPVLVVPPTIRAKYATGKGNAGKDEVLLAASKAYPDAGFTDNNQADAVVLAAIGARMLDYPVDHGFMSAPRMAALKSLSLF